MHHTDPLFIQAEIDYRYDRHRGHHRPGDRSSRPVRRAGGPGRSLARLGRHLRRTLLLQHLRTAPREEHDEIRVRTHATPGRA